MKRTVATVAVDNTFFSFDTDYSYLVPEELADKAQAGCAVSVPFGRGDTLREGFLKSVTRFYPKKWLALHCGLKSAVFVLPTTA